MARHAGFGAVATLREKTINDAIVSYTYGQLGPFFFPLPTTIVVGEFVTVTLAGVVEMMPPRIELHEDANDRVAVHLTLRSTLRAKQLDQQMKTWTIEWTDTVKAGLVTTVQQQQIVVGIDTQNVVLGSLQVKVLKGPPPPPAIMKALESPDLSDSATAFVQSLPPITIAPPALRSQITHTQPLELPWVIDQNWFTIDLTASKIVAKPLEHALTLAIDFQGLTQGDADKLVDLTVVAGPGLIYDYLITPETEPNLAPQTVHDEDGNLVGTEWVNLGPPKLAQKPEPAGGDIAFVLNMNVLKWVVAHQISPQVWDTPIYPDIALTSVGIRHAVFVKDLAGLQSGLAIDFHVQVQKGTWFGVDGTIYLQAFRQHPDGPTEFVYEMGGDTWRVYVSDVEVDLPLWVDVAVVVLAVVLPVAFPLLSTMVAVFATMALAELIPGLIEDIETRAQLGMNKNSLDIPASSSPLPGLTEPTWQSVLRYLSFTPESVDTALDTSPDHDLTQDPRGTIWPDHWSAGNKQPISVGVTLRDDLEKRAADLTVSWNVRRADTNQLILTASKVYNDPAGNGVLIPHHTPELYVVGEFVVLCSVQLTLGGQVGEIWSAKHTITVDDYLDRRHKYVQWGPHEVHFINEGTDGWWMRNRTSRIHRTAVSARCKMLVQRMHDYEHGIPNLTYFDQLPFSWSALNSHRKPLCEYCFFGGPDKADPYPEEDWF